MKWFIQISILVIMLIAFQSCFLKHDLGIFTTGNPPYGTIRLFPDFTYSADYKMAGYSNGKWEKKGDTIILNSKYNSCCIPILKTYFSKSDTSKNCVINLKNKCNLTGSIGLILKNDTHLDSLWVFESVRTIEKSKNYTSFIILNICKMSMKLSAKTTSLARNFHNNI